MKIETISAETIKPSSPTSPHHKTYRISLLDELSPPLHVPIVLFYSSPDSCNFNISERLKTSLSTTLAHFFPLAGSLKRNATVDCNDKGITYVEAKVNLDISEILENPEMNLLQQFLPFDPYRNWPEEELTITGVQVNYFDCGGIAIGLCIYHRIVDGASLAKFLSDWSATANEGSEISTPYMDSASLFPPKVLNIVMPSEVISKEKTVTKRFIFDGHKLGLLKGKIACINPTKVEAVTSLIWKSAMCASREAPSSIVTHVVNIRGRMSPPLPENSLGNLWQLTVSPVLHKEEIRNMELKELAEEVRKSIRNINGDYVKLIQNDDGISKACAGQREARRLCSEGVACYRFSSWTRFPFYEINFGWGNPTWVCTTNVPIKDVVILMGTRNGDGIEAWVTLAEHNMAAFEQDNDLKEFVTVASK